MKKVTFFKIILISSSFLLFNSCKKISVNSITLKNTKSTDALNFPFDWTKATEMPVSPSSPYDPSMPWQSQSGSYIDAYLVSDYNYNDGWRLVYNTFDTTVIATASQEPAGGLYFALYNRYRGLLRFYLYIPPGLFGNSSDIEHGLSLYTDNGSTSSMLNFEGSDLVDPSINVDSITKTNNTGVAVGGGWYAMQYEIAYDPNFAATVYPDLGFAWNSRTVNISQIQVDGSQTGTISGNITKQSGGFNWPGQLKNVGAAAIGIHGIASANSFGTIASALTKAISQGLAGNILGFFSGIFGGNSTDTQEVDLKMNTDLSLNGTLTSSQPLVPNTLVVPGQTVGNTVGAPPPLINQPLGVFNLTGRPTIDETTTESQVTNPPGMTGIYNQYVNSYSVDNNIFNQVFVTNPDVINSADTGTQIENLKTEVVILNPVIPSNPYALQIGGTLDTIGNYVAITGTSVGTTYTVVRNQPPNDSVAVRVSFNVVPNNGAPSSMIVKTFIANIVHQ